MKIKMIFDLSSTIEDQSNDKVLINMSYDEYLTLRKTLLTAFEEDCTKFYDLLTEAREKAKIEWK